MSKTKSKTYLVTVTRAWQVEVQASDEGEAERLGLEASHEDMPDWTEVQVEEQEGGSL